MSVNQAAGAHSHTEKKSALKLTLFHVMSHRLSRVALALLAVAALTIFMPLWMSIMLMIIIYIHEYGHLWAMKKAGVETRGVYAVPLLGAVTIGKVQYVGPSANVLIALAGPATGLPLAVATAPLAILTQNRYLIAFAALTLFINLFNLIPVSPLDGGRVVDYLLTGKDVMRLVASSLAFMVGIILVFLYPSILTGFFALCGAFSLVVSASLWHANRKYGPVELAMYVPMNKAQLLWSFAGYVLLVVSLLALSFWLIAGTHLNELFR